MSFFGNMLAGAANGVGQGMVAYGQQQDLERQRQIANEEKAALALQLQAERSADKADQNALRLQLAGMSGGAGGSAGGGKGGGTDIDQMILAADTPEKQDKVLRYLSLKAPPETVALVADKMFGRPLMEEGKNYSSDPRVTVDDNGVSTVGPSTKVAYNSKAGVDALNFVTQLASGKAMDAAGGQRQFNLNANGRDATQGIKDPLQSAETYQAVTDPASRLQVQQEKNVGDLKEVQARAAAKGTGGGPKSSAQEKLTTEKNAALRERTGYVSQLKDAGKAARPAIQAKIDAVDSDLARINGLLADARPGSAAVPAPTANTGKVEVWVRDPKTGKVVRG